MTDPCRTVVLPQTLADRIHEVRYTLNNLTRRDAWQLDELRAELRRLIEEQAA